MRATVARGMILMLAIGGMMMLSDAANVGAADDDGPMLAHMVYFSLKDNSAAATQKLVAACKKYLSKHEGTIFFAAGTLAKDLDRPVNDRGFDVSLHIVFRNKAAQDKYQDAKRHHQFIDENKDNWSKVRVFDSVVSK